MIVNYTQTTYADRTNDLADAARLLNVARVAAAGYLVTCREHGIAVTPERRQGYTDALNRKLAVAYQALRALGKRATTPKVTFGDGRKCDIRCTSARGSDCVCQCGGLNHGIDTLRISRAAQASEGYGCPMFGPAEHS